MKTPTEKMMQTVSRLPLGNRPPVESLLRAEASPFSWIEPSVLLGLMFQARHAYTVANSYRDFNVGAAMSAHKGPLRGVVVGANIKPEAETVVNVHAEQQAMQVARDLGYRSVSMVVVIGNTQADQQSGHEMHTLHPCGLCRTAMSESPLIDNDKTLIVSALPDFQTIELSTINKLVDYHEHGEKAAVELVEFPKLRLFEPAATGGSVIRINDDEQAYQEDRLWGKTMALHLRKYRTND